MECLIKSFNQEKFVGGHEDFQCNSIPLLATNEAIISA